MGQGLDIFGQGGGRQVVVVAHQDSGGNQSLVQVVVGLFTGVQVLAVVEWLWCF